MKPKVLPPQTPRDIAKSLVSKAAETFSVLAHWCGN
jgi:hypothetical protein